ncbi:MAG: glycoside hydrolase family 92 protein, partial [Clostridia bacterium]|nr:glycoside hydrolase family 92 protein [Clostridia bacterium]
ADGFFARAMAAAEIAESFEGKPFRSLRLPDPEKHREIYREQAYAPGSLSITLGLLIADYALAQMAEAMGHKEAAAALTARAARYGENYNPATGFMGPRDECGRFIPVRDEFDETGCTEANILQQTWEVPYDVEGLFGLLGRERGIALLEEFFEKADLSALWNIWYNHSNEPCHNLTHYFNILGLPHRTQYWTRRVQKESYRQGAFGFCGNEDVGQISGWYVLSAMGFAQVCPTDKRYQVNTPLFRRVSLRLSKRYHTRRLGDTFTVICDRDPLEYPYIEKLRLNGVELDRRYVTYEEIVDGGELEFILASEPV